MSLTHSLDCRFKPYWSLAHVVNFYHTVWIQYLQKRCVSPFFYLILDFEVIVYSRYLPIYLEGCLETPGVENKSEKNGYSMIQILGVFSIFQHHGTRYLRYSF